MSEIEPAFEPPTFVARASCGCVRAAAVDSPERKKDTAKAVAEMIRRGYAVETIPTPTVRTMPWNCAEHKTVKP